jgi:hypothetical protein
LRMGEAHHMETHTLYLKIENIIPLMRLLQSVSHPH